MRRQPIELWASPVDGAGEVLRSLAQHMRLAVVSNADGTVEESLRRRGMCQVGNGPLPSVAAIVDSAIVGVSKPDARIFEPAIGALGVEPSEACYIGDSERFDVRAAEAAGIRPIHFDPYALCRNPTAHLHLESLSHIDRLLD